VSPRGERKKEQDLCEAGCLRLDCVPEMGVHAASSVVSLVVIREATEKIEFEEVHV
jgi:hypothetical protein